MKPGRDGTVFEGWREAVRGQQETRARLRGAAQLLPGAGPPSQPPPFCPRAPPLGRGRAAGERGGCGALRAACRLPARPSAPAALRLLPAVPGSLSLGLHYRVRRGGSAETAPASLRHRHPCSSSSSSSPRPSPPSLPPSPLPVSLQLVHPHTGSRPPRLPWISAKAPAAGRTGQRGAPHPRSVAPPGPRRPPCRRPALPSLPPRACPTGARRPRGREGREKEQAERESGRASPRQCPRA